MTTQQTTLSAGWSFDNSYARLPTLFFTRQQPASVRSPRLVIFNRTLAAELGLNASALESGEGAAIFAGNRIPEGAEPLAQAYAGHQFGHFTMLGDGRAILLGEQMTPEGKRVDIQWKGSGRTSYSRGGDGRAVLGPMLREYIISEAMHGLGIPTTRSLAVTVTGEEVIRDTELTGAILTRVAASHLRVGTFQLAARWGTADDVRTLADYAIERHYPEAAAADNRYIAFLQEVIKRQAALIARWMLVGFVHGVMNTDNMAISGETIDYGPCAFIDIYDPATVFSSIDARGRYAYGNQPYIAAWNLARLAEALLPLLDDDEEKAVKLAEEAIAGFGPLYDRNWLSGMRAKLGLFNEEEGDLPLAEELLRLMQEHKADYTNIFRGLATDQPEETALASSEEFAAWLERWQARLSRQQQDRAASVQLMQQSSPSVIPR
ncbi:MAG: hypothetical protein K0Q59_4207, partial [Paenibacillus sp.]|nr:hypothetical protein [Paenibacillus sp.]